MAQEQLPDPVTGLEAVDDAGGDQGDPTGGSETGDVDGNRQPVAVGQISRTNTPYNGIAVGGGVYVWGHLTAYKLVIIDNNGNHYGLGRPKESFPSDKIVCQPHHPHKPNGGKPGSLWPKGAVFTDSNRAFEYYGATKTASPNTLWYQFQQNWQVVEPTKTWPVFAHDNISHYEDHATRSGLQASQ